MSTTVANPAAVFPESTAAIPEAHRCEYYADGARYLIDGQVRSWSGPVEEVLSPVCVGGPGAGRFALGHYPRMTAVEANAALAAARRAYDQGAGRWPALSVAERIRHVEQFLPRMVAQRDAVVRLLMWEIGKSLGDARKEFDRTVEYIRDTINALKDLDRTSARFVVEQGFVAQIRRSPLGVVLCMGPYNYPLNETFTTLIPALIMGNTVVFKPPRYGVLLHAPLLSAFAESFPPGVVNTVYGDGREVVGPLMESGAVDVLAFIGSARVASILKHQHPRPSRLRCIFGLEAKNPAIILPDADLDIAVRECVSGALSFNGQRCTALKIIFVARAIAETFVARFSEAVGKLVVGMPWEDGVQITPLPEENKPGWLDTMTRAAVTSGGRIVNAAGGTIDRSLYYPAVIVNPALDTPLCREEQFGPLVPIVAYDDLTTVTDWIEASAVGQQASIFGRDAATIGRLVDFLVNQVSRVNLNSQCQRGPDTFPFTGRKDSAEGTLSVTDALRVFSIRTLVAAKADDTNERLVSDIVTSRTSKFLSTDFIF